MQFIYNNDGQPDGATVYYQNISGRVGVGTNNPQELLEVQGTIQGELLSIDGTASATRSDRFVTYYTDILLGGVPYRLGIRGYRFSNQFSILQYALYKNGTSFLTIPNGQSNYQLQTPSGTAINWNDIKPNWPGVEIGYEEPINFTLRFGSGWINVPQSLQLRAILYPVIWSNPSNNVIYFNNTSGGTVELHYLDSEAIWYPRRW